MIAESLEHANERLLVVDDEPDVLRLEQMMLTRAGYHVTEAISAEAALDHLHRESDIDMVLSDLRMPGRDGLELLREIRARYPDIAVVMVTGDGDIETAVECLKLGARDYLTKPFVYAEMFARVSKALEGRRVSLENRRFREQYQSDLERQVGVLSQKNKAMFLEQVQMAVTMLEAKDPYTRGHSHRVAQYAVSTAREMGLRGPLLEEILLGGELHDIGKIGTRDAVLHKAGRLTEEEFAHVREHTTAGADMLKPLQAEHPEVLHITRSHHERIDGKGFPDGLSGDNIPLTARIVCVVDAFDAMTSNRAYVEARHLDVVLAEISRCAGSQFDPTVVKAFIAIVGTLAPLMPM